MKKRRIRGWILFVTGIILFSYLILPTVIEGGISWVHPTMLKVYLLWLSLPWLLIYFGWRLSHPKGSL